MLNRGVVQPNPAVFIGMVADTMQTAVAAASLEELREGSVEIAKSALVVHCAAAGLQYPPLVPIWGPSAITLQPIRAGFPCFGAALAGYVEATRQHDVEKNRLCPPTPYPDTLAGWATMTVLGARATMSFGSEPDIKDWANKVPLNPARIPPEHGDSAELSDAVDRLQTHLHSGLNKLAELSGECRRRPKTDPLLPTCPFKAGVVRAFSPRGQVARQAVAPAEAAPRRDRPPNPRRRRTSRHRQMRRRRTSRHRQMRGRSDPLRPRHFHTTRCTSWSTSSGQR